MTQIVLADTTTLRWRGGSSILFFIAVFLFVSRLADSKVSAVAGGLVSLPFVVNGFVAAEIAQGVLGVDGAGWRWGESRSVCFSPLSSPSSPKTPCVTQANPCDSVV